MSYLNYLILFDNINIEDDGLHSCYFTLQEGNMLDGSQVWNNVASGPLPASRFLHQAPHFWGSKPWPAIGADVDGGGLTKLPAEEWYDLIVSNGSGIPFPSGGF